VHLKVKANQDQNLHNL